MGRLTAKGLVVDYAQGFARWFNKVIWATSLFTGKAYAQTLVDTKRIIPCIVGGRIQSLFRDYLILRQFVDKQTIIFLHLPNPWLTITVLALKRKAHGFFVYVANDYVGYSEMSRRTHGIIYSRLYRFIHELPIRLADGVIVRGKLNLKRVSQLNLNVIETIPIGLKPPRFERIKEPFSSQSKCIQILYVGKLVKGKGVEILLKSFHDLCNRLYDKEVFLTIVGTGPEEEKLKKEALALGVANRVTFTGFIDDTDRLSELYAGADVLVVPSTYPEGMPRVIEEAILHGTPVIASSLGSIREQFLDGEVVLVPPENVTALSDAIYRLIYDSGFRKNVIELTTKKRFEKTLEWECASQQHAKFILGDFERVRFYQNPVYINHRKISSDLRIIHSPELIDLFSGKRVLEIGCGAVPQDHLGSYYVGVDISFRALNEGKGRGKRVVADARRLPFKDGSFDAVLTIAVLEHISEPQQVLEEVIRVLCSGGIVVHQDAWNVPSWRTLGLAVKSYGALNFSYKMLKFFLPIIESLPCRVLRILPARIWRLVRSPKDLDYRRLKPNYNLPELSDADACSSIDSHSVLLFYKARGFELINPKDKLLNQLLHRGIIIVRKRLHRK